MAPHYFLYSDPAQKAIKAMEQGKSSVVITLDLNRSDQVVKISGNRLQVEAGITLTRDQLDIIAQTKGKVFWLKDSGPRPLEVRQGRYCKLVPTRTAPILEIDGIKMHRSKDIDPLEDARLKAELTIKGKDLVLDTCGGLGYSALGALKAGAEKVVSAEKNPGVILIRNLNPWLTDNPLSQKIHLVNKDVFRYIQELDDGSIDVILHDPPRFSSATGDLYGKAFYNQLFRVLKTNGRLFHYTGSPKRIKQGTRFVANVQKRLERTGFCGLEFNQTLQGVLGLKP